MSAAEQKRPIGVFDSGLGGLTVLKEIMDYLPGENTIYFGDSGRMPYGNKSGETVIRYALQNTRFLLSQNVKMIVIACNTVSAQAYDQICKLSSVPVVEVVNPGSRAALAQTGNYRIGVIGTRGTVASGVYPRAIRKLADRPVTVLQKACPLFVSLAEEGWWDHPVTRKVAEIYLTELLEDKVDTLVLGCTHYPLLSEVIGSVAGSAVQLIQAGVPVAEEIKRILKQAALLNETSRDPVHRFYTSDSVAYFQSLGKLFLKRPLDPVDLIDIESY